MQQRQEDDQIISQFDHNIDFDKFLCSQNCPAQLICTSKCQHQPFKCYSKTCQCRMNHKNCSLSFIQSITQKINLNKRIVSQYTVQSFQVYQKILDDMIQYISLMRQKMYNCKENYGLTQEQIIFLFNLKALNYNQIKGNHLHEILNKVNEPRKFIKGKQQIVKYWQQFQISFKNTCQQLQKNCFLIDQIALSSSQKQTIQKWIEESTQKKVKSLKHLFKASEHDFKSEQFHKKCDYFQNTLSLIKTQFDKIIGGFNPMNWHSQKNQLIDDKSKSVFIFSLSENQKYDCINYQNSIYLSNQNGPCFGGYPQNDHFYNMDICIKNKCNQDRKSFSRFSTCYNLYGKYKDDQYSWTKFSGNKNNRVFNVIDYQVYHVIFFENIKQQSKNE